MSGIKRKYGFELNLVLQCLYLIHNYKQVILKVNLEIPQPI